MPPTLLTLSLTKVQIYNHNHKHASLPLFLSPNIKNIIMSLVRSFAGNRNSSGVRSYWIFEEDDNHAIEKWLDNLLGADKMKFYGGFINWGMKQVDKARDPSAKYKTADDEEKTRNALTTLRVPYPADQKRFCDLMTVYYKRCYVRGSILRGIVPDPESESEFFLALFTFS